MAGAYWGPPCFGYQGGPQQTPAILPAKSKLPRSDFETKCLEVETGRNSSHSPLFCRIRKAVSVSWREGAHGKFDNYNRYGNRLFSKKSNNAPTSVVSRHIKKLLLYPWNQYAISLFRRGSRVISPTITSQNGRISSER